jgi:hypothetical protein
MHGKLKAQAPIPGALFDLTEDMPTADPLAELLQEILMVENQFDYSLLGKPQAA